MYVGSESTPYFNQRKADTSAQRAVLPLCWKEESLCGSGRFLEQHVLQRTGCFLTTSSVSNGMYGRVTSLWWRDVEAVVQNRLRKMHGATPSKDLCGFDKGPGPLLGPLDSARISVAFVNLFRAS
eukprot:scaffold100487_cov23-Tisochrysis_lutea.AAC.3